MSHGVCAWMRYYFLLPLSKAIDARCPALYAEGKVRRMVSNLVTTRIFRAGTL